MGESEIISILSNSEIFNLTSILKTLIRGIGWGIINLLAFISNGIETVVNEIYSLNGFFSSQQLNDFIDVDKIEDSLQELVCKLEVEK